VAKSSGGGTGPGFLGNVEKNHRALPKAGNDSVKNWNCVLELAEDRSVRSGGYDRLVETIRRGADLRVQTQFRHNEHIDTRSANDEAIQEVAEFRVTYLLDDRWAAGIMNLRQPISLPDSFGPRSSMSLFLYNQDGTQAIARPFLDGRPVEGKAKSEAVKVYDHSDMPRFHLLEEWDENTNAPSRNFIYDFDYYRFYVRDDWRQVLSHRGDGTVLSGSIDELADAFNAGCELKAAVSDLCCDVDPNARDAVKHEVFVQVGSGYYYTQQKLFIAGTHPVVRVQPAIPLRYGSRNWDFGWLMLRTDGHAVLRLYDPYTLKCRDANRHLALRWFVR
jgi:hypothetical protein